MIFGEFPLPRTRLNKSSWGTKDVVFLPSPAAPRHRFSERGALLRPPDGNLACLA
jgi:hypothetical protein